MNLAEPSTKLPEQWRPVAQKLALACRDDAKTALGRVASALGSQHTTAVYRLALWMSRGLPEEEQIQLILYHSWRSETFPGISNKGVPLLGKLWPTALSWDDIPDV